MRYNPFRPGNIVTPGMFAGRGRELEALERILFQTKHANPQHFLITGERGIGKSSLLYYLQLTASGALTTSDGSKFNFLTVPVELEPTDDFESVVCKVGGELRSTVAKLERVRTFAKDSWDFLKRWEVMGVKFDGNAVSRERHKLLDELCQSILTTLDRLKDEVDGCVIFIDEADKPPASAHVGAFAKLLTERLTKRHAHKVALGLTGVTGIVSKLRESHESAPRVFHTLTLDALEHADRLAVVQKGLDEARSKNEKQTQIEDEALNAISYLSEGLPNFIQQFAFCAFDADSDWRIDADDVMNGAFNDNGAFDQLGQKYFSELYFDQIGSDEYRNVLRAMAKHSDGWVTKAELKRLVKLKPATLNNAVNALKKRGIIIPQPGKQGVYRLPNKSFAVWIRAYTQERPKVATTEAGEVDEKGNLALPFADMSSDVTEAETDSSEMEGGQ